MSGPLSSLVETMRLRMDSGNDHVVQGFVPVLGIELGGHDGGAAVFPSGEDVQQFTARIRGDRGGAKVVQNQDIAVVQAAKAGQPSRVGTVVDGELVREVIEPEVSCGVVAPAGNIDQGLGEVGSSNTGFSEDDQVRGALDPPAGGEPCDDFRVQGPAGKVVDFLNTGRPGSVFSIP